MISPAQSVRAFISYSRADADIVHRLKTALAEVGADVWLDYERLTPGTRNFQVAVREGIEQATVVVYVASPTACVSPYVIDELGLASDKGKRVIPFWARGDAWHDCVPLGWGAAQYIDGHGVRYNAGIAELLGTLGLMVAPPIPAERFPAHLINLGFTAHVDGEVEFILPQLCPIPAGPFRLGSERARDIDAGWHETRRTIVDLPVFQIARFPVTVAEYACFIHATKKEPPPASIYKRLTWEDQQRALDHPVVGVSWHDAYDYAAWLANLTGQPWRLPSEAEWEKAARCDPRDPLGASSERIYPWGDRFDQACCNIEMSGIGRTSPVGWYGPNDPNPHAGRKSGASPCDAEDMVGNVWEWMGNAYRDDYTLAAIPLTRDSFELRTVRGGSWQSARIYARAASRLHSAPDYVAAGSGGFRLAFASAGS